MSFGCKDFDDQYKLVANLHGRISRWQKSRSQKSMRPIFFAGLTSRKQRSVAQAIREPKTKKMQAIIHMEMAVMPSTLGEMLVMVLKMLTSTRKSVTRSAMRPGTTSGGIKKLTQETMTKRPLGKQQMYKYLERERKGLWQQLAWTLY